MTDFTPFSAIIGGGLIGAAALLLLLLNGNVAGISGILANSIRDLKDRSFWRLLFIAGLILGCYISFTFLGIEPPKVPRFSTLTLIVAGLLVGFGTVLGSGCTSGHGVCGIARFSKRSITATSVFLSVGIMTATIIGVVTQ